MCELCDPKVNVTVQDVHEGVTPDGYLLRRAGTRTLTVISPTDEMIRAMVRMADEATDMG